MIWHKKNGHLKKSLRIGVVLLSIFCSLFSSFLSTSNASAISIGFNSPYIYFYKNNNFSNTGGSVSGTRPFTGDNFNNVYNPNNQAYNTSYLFESFYPGSSDNKNPYQMRLYTLTNAIGANSATISAEYNFVITSTGGRYYQIDTSALDLAQVGDIKVRDSYNATSLTKNVSYAVTNWQMPLVNQYQQTIAYQTTVTFYVNVAVSGLTTTSSGYYSFDLFTPRAFVRELGSASVGFYSEKGKVNIEYFNSADDATQKAQLNIMNLQYTLQQQQYNLQQQQYEQDQQDRDNIENRANDSEDQGENASQNAQNASTPLIGAITQIYAIVMNPQTTDCDIGPINLYNQMDLGTLDMCTFSIPQPLMAIGALITIGLILLLAWSVLHCAVALYKDLFGK